MRVIAEIYASSNLCLTEEGACHTVKHPTGDFSATIRNNPDALPFAKRSLIIEIEFEVESLNDAREMALDHLAVLQNALSLATGARISDAIVIRAIDWTPGVEMRDARYYHTSQATLSFSALDSALMDTVERLVAVHDDEVSQSVMRWYRLGMRSQIAEEQFSYFWFAIEIVAEKLKEAGKIAPPCPKCSSDLFCPACNETPLRRRFGTEAIADLIRDVAPTTADVDELTKTLFKIRNTLQHGRRIHSIAGSLPCTEEQAVTVLANIAWRAIDKLADWDKDPRPDNTLNFVLIEDVVHKAMVVSAAVQIGLMSGGDPNDPDLVHVGNVQISTIINGKAYTFDGQPVAE
ncbi:hypothetical protein PIB19_12030 [Sphingomonas sp. 7/4-4]|uniref:methylamine utilization protein MauJ n=1 Tax=Sphingomonas sp. 7/4-4 TaxID=3018446 RepID=UPI0022F39FF0|nr:methylamine utilization protein MauJ [Sphingomonas sp. 7/4-4]WBY06345.1 hypothetical protein PIB19_12030 [Sphingomonas sp. 7/4-4]